MRDDVGAGEERGLSGCGQREHPQRPVGGRRGEAPRQDPPATAPTQAQPVRPPVAPPPDPYESVGYPQQGYQQGHRRRRKGGFLGDLFDFD